MAKSRLVKAAPLEEFFENKAKSWAGTWSGPAYSTALDQVKAAPTVDAVELPKGKPGDYVKWTTGVSERLYEISAIVICKDGMRYDLGDICPFVNHPNILEIMSCEQAERWMQGGNL